MRSMASRACPTALLLSVLFLAALPANAALVLSFDSVALNGAPGDLITITGILTNDGALTEELTSLDSVGLVSPVVILGPGGVLAPSVLGYPDSYSGPIVQFQISPGAAPGSYGANTFSLTYGSINGRSITSNAVTFSVDVESTGVPEPASAALLATGLCAFLLMHRRLTSPGSRRYKPAQSCACY
ncbi:MAG: PEP-CTERM sorting domain-containing protein [Acidobacteriota bacterium]